MKFSQNGLYIDKYIKCANCGTLVYVDEPKEMKTAVQVSDRLFCSQWCVDWAEARRLRRGELVES
ncbi:hypothetical protein AWB77_04541 [Caballeronia fortuita]|uniref:Uncharacterized protein n=1 Tax=Caballeronia fortuita TaxID=1777138 RepID=A0A158CU75_9BURK|nr:hypothetical protein [Caballeronia fortuita]SAK85874.1 hypothetical protein AWB77_04541 [Caballeronia fortuita]